MMMMMMMMMMIKLRTSRYLDVSQRLALLPSLLWSVTVVRTKFRPDTVGAPCQRVHRCSLSRNGTEPSPQRLHILSNNVVPNISLSGHFSYICSYKCETNLPPFGWAEDHCLIQEASFMKWWLKCLPLAYNCCKSNKVYQSSPHEKLVISYLLIWQIHPDKLHNICRYTNVKK